MGNFLLHKYIGGWCPYCLLTLLFIFISKCKNHVFRKFHFCWFDLSNSHTKQNYQFCKIFPCSSLCSQCCIKCISKMFSRKTGLNTLMFIIILKFNIITPDHLPFSSFQTLPYVFLSCCSSVGTVPRNYNSISWSPWFIHIELQI